MNKGLAISYKVDVYYYIAQLIRDIALLKNLVTCFNSGRWKQCKLGQPHLMLYINYAMFLK